AHHYEAVLARPDLPPSRAALGCALGRAGRPAEAADHLRLAPQANPFDHEAARALFQALTDAGDEAAAPPPAPGRPPLPAARPRPPSGRGRPPPRAPPPAPAPPLRAQPPPPGGSARRFGSPDTSRALCGFTGPKDTHAVLALLSHCRPRRVLEVGTALGHMTA